MTNDVEYFFICRMSVQIFCPFSVGLFAVFAIECMSSLCILDVGPLPGRLFSLISPFCELSFHFHDAVL